MAVVRGPTVCRVGGQPRELLHFSQWHHRQTSLEPVSQVRLITPIQSLSETRDKASSPEG